MKEIETKILGVHPSQIALKLKRLGAKQILKTRLVVDWYRFPVGKSDDDQWFLRIRKRSDGSAETTWKSRSKKVGITKQARDITCEVANPEMLATIFEGLGLASYAHQEKDRISWQLKKWRFDLDQYPGMPAYLEIEGTSATHVAKAISLLGLQKHRALPEGERTLIEREYGLNWHDMRF